MVNIQGCTRMMVNRCIELLRARIECASTRHIARRYQQSRDQGKVLAQYLPEEQVVREREKADIYKKNKRRSMWEQDEGHGGRVTGRDNQERFDDEQYRPRELEKRNYDCTWVNFPESVAAKQSRRKSYLDVIEDETPRRRRSQEDRPNTAKPWDDEARAFINQWETNTAMINRNRFARTTDSCPPPIVSSRMSNAYRTRKRQFLY
ncbi:uncharacterized protein LOC119558808 isoform X1 [Drosophila subpulchrella]|uniref:uncharacterized protein LOC119558808 isoform X1 n=1 Tax=Drosophila subpulchrella TaxID=1486046 RepID=UPI0018A12FEA|nr:uncharacterized protein LOC119558808 isoform X1 [Drosophila subpulchrella]